MRKTILLLAFCFFSIIAISTIAQTTNPVQQTIPKNIPQQIYNETVSIISKETFGSGVLKTRDNVSYVWTAGHVVEPSVIQRITVDENGIVSYYLQFDQVLIIQDVKKDGKVIGQIRTGADIIAYSKSSDEDLALLRLRGKQFKQSSSKFYNAVEIPEIGTPVYHCGSFKGNFSPNAFTEGIISSVGAVMDDRVFDRTTCVAAPGCSGGGIFLKDGTCIGLLVRVTGDSFNHFVPIRRMSKWAKDQGLLFTLDDSIPVPARYK